ncbi:MAG: response regulator [Rickettsiales bacterium]|nr:response regulator [Rickettsiales bacterium]
MNFCGRVLTIDDQEEDLEILNHILKKSNYETISARNGLEALDMLDKNSAVDVIVLDRMMPKMDGMSFIRRIKEDNRFRDTPIIMQTAMNEDYQIQEGIEAGVYWYITKPFNQNMLASLVKSAYRANKRNKKISAITDFYIDSRKKFKGGMDRLNSANFCIKTIEEARDLAHTIAIAYTEPKIMVGAISELLVNAVEHGNLGISFEEKHQLILDGMWEDEIEYRYNMPENQRKSVQVNLFRENGELILKIKDDGDGFDVKPFLSFDSDRAFKANGRGIYLASLAFNKIEYSTKGNEVTCWG